MPASLGLDTENYIHRISGPSFAFHLNYREIPRFRNPHTYERELTNVEFMELKIQRNGEDAQPHEEADLSPQRFTISGLPDALNQLRRTYDTLKKWIRTQPGLLEHQNFILNYLTITHQMHSMSMCHVIFKYYISTLFRSIVDHHQEEHPSINMYKT